MIQILLMFQHHTLLASSNYSCCESGCNATMFSKYRVSHPNCCNEFYGTFLTPHHVLFNWMMPQCFLFIMLSTNQKRNNALNAVYAIKQR